MRPNHTIHAIDAFPGDPDFAQVALPALPDCSFPKGKLVLAVQRLQHRSEEIRLDAVRQIAELFSNTPDHPLMAKAAICLLTPAINDVGPIQELALGTISAFYPQSQDAIDQLSIAYKRTPDRFQSEVFTEQIIPRFSTDETTTGTADSLVGLRGLRVPKITIPTDLFHSRLKNACQQIVEEIQSILNLDTAPPMVSVNPFNFRISSASGGMNIQFSLIAASSLLALHLYRTHNLDIPEKHYVAITAALGVCVHEMAHIEQQRFYPDSGYSLYSRSGVIAENEQVRFKGIPKEAKRNLFHQSLRSTWGVGDTSSESFSPSATRHSFFFELGANLQVERRLNEVLNHYGLPPHEPFSTGGYVDQDLYPNSTDPVRAKEAEYLRLANRARNIFTGGDPDYQTAVNLENKPEPSGVLPAVRSIFGQITSRVAHISADIQRACDTLYGALWLSDLIVIPNAIIQSILVKCLR